VIFDRAPGSDPPCSAPFGLAPSTRASSSWLSRMTFQQGLLCLLVFFFACLIFSFSFACIRAASWAIAARPRRYLADTVKTAPLLGHFGYWPFPSSPRLRRSLQLMALAPASSYLSGASFSVAVALGNGLPNRLVVLTLHCLSCSALPDCFVC